MAKKLTINPLLGIRGRPMKLPARDEDGEAIPIPGSDAVVVMVGNTWTLLETLSYVIGAARAIQKPNDAFRIASIMAALDVVPMVADGEGGEAVAPGAEVKLQKKTYDWLIAKLKTKVPVTAAEMKVLVLTKEMVKEIAPLPFVQTIFSIHSNAVLVHLGADPIGPTDEDEEDED